MRQVLWEGSGVDFRVFKNIHMAALKSNKGSEKEAYPDKEMQPKQTPLTQGNKQASHGVGPSKMRTNNKEKV